ncbi:MAG: cryptochrome/photolyase family protein [Gammaproteobacteria bacterium]
MTYSHTTSGPVRDIYFVLGDQLDQRSSYWDNFDLLQDVVFMTEVVDESVAIPSSQTRTALFFSAMRHFAIEQSEHRRLCYYDISHTRSQQLSSLDDALIDFIQSQRDAGNTPRQVIMVLAGDSRVKIMLEETAIALDIPLQWQADDHFLAEAGEFKKWLSGRKVPIMEHWYRHIRKRLGLLMTAEGKPVGGEWNFDKANRKAFSAKGPEDVPQPTEFTLDDISQQVLKDIAPLNLAGEQALQYWPVTRSQARQLLDEFIEHRLPRFGDYQDAMWTDEPWLFHARISAALNTKLLHPAEVCHAAEAAYHAGHAPINAVEGFIRQIAGWREYIRGLYWSHHKDWLSMNALNATADLPEFYWTGKTDMTCMQQSLKQVLSYGYGHHIQRLMVTGLFALLYGIKPKQIHSWYLAMYVDAIAWVEVPNTLGMSQFADGGIVGTKPYIASGAYIGRMSNYCKQCPYDPKLAKGDKACPFTALYWQFIDTHQELIGNNHRLRMQLNNWFRKDEDERLAILDTAQRIRLTIEESH